MQVAGCHASWLATDDRPNRHSWLNCSTSQREKLIPGGRRTTALIIRQRGEPGSPPHPETGAKDHRLGYSLCGTRTCGGLGFNKEGTYNRMIVSPFFEASTRGGSRTHTPLRARDFESRVSANSTTLATESVTVECIKSTPPYDYFKYLNETDDLQAGCRTLRKRSSNLSRNAATQPNLPE